MPLIIAACVNVGGAIAASPLRQGRDLQGEDLHGADFAGENLRGARLMHANLRRGDLRRADLRGANLTEATLTDADLRGAKLNKARVTSAVLRNAKLRGADLTGALLSGALVDEADFSRADLTNATLDSLDLAGVSFRNAKLDGTSLRDAQLGDADFTGARLDAIDLYWAEVQGAIGLSDERLAAALGVPLNELGRAFKERGLQPESSQSIRAALNSACAGTPVSGAGSAAGATYHPLVAFGIGTGYDVRWEPPALRFAEYVGCADPAVSEVVETCSYVGTTTGQEASRDRLQYSRRVRVVKAATGEIVSDQTLQGPPPEPCPETTTILTPIGSAPPVSDVFNLFVPFVGQLPNPPAIARPTTLTVFATPTSGPPGTRVRIRAPRCPDLARTEGRLTDLTDRLIAQGETLDPETIDLTVPADTKPGGYLIQLSCGSTTGSETRGGNVAFEVTKPKTTRR